MPEPGTSCQPEQVGRGFPSSPPCCSSGRQGCAGADSMREECLSDVLQKGRWGLPGLPPIECCRCHRSISAT
ncbi:hypothetical protein E2320_017130, partial [Naja naja]